MKTTLSSKGQIVLPVELRQKDAIHPGTQFEVERVETGRYLLKKLPASGSSGVLAWLQSCPENNWFRSVPSESTDDL